MRTTKRFSPAVLRRFEKQGRGTGIFTDYLPWHRVGRGDPASIGRSHLCMFESRQVELLSDGELGVFFWISMLPDIYDLREQFPLAIQPDHHELAPYQILRHEELPGTLGIAKRLGIRHPRTNGDGFSDWWRMTTDFLVTLKPQGCPPKLLAISCKASADLQRKRTTDLLRIEQEYWIARNVEWLLITENQYDESAVDTLARIAGWALERPVGNVAIKKALTLLHMMQDRPQSAFIDALAQILGDTETAKRALWQGVWQGIIPLDLRRGWRPHLPLRLLSHEAFRALNPVASRRSAWN